MLLERYRLATTGQASKEELRTLRTERDEYGYEAILRSRPSLLGTVFGGTGHLPYDSFHLSQAFQHGYAVASPAWRFWNREATFVDLPTLPDGPSARPLGKSIVELLVGLLAPIVDTEFLSAARLEEILNEIAPVATVSFEQGERNIRAWLNARPEFGPNPTDHMRGVRDRVQRRLDEMHARRHQAAQPVLAPPRPTPEEQIGELIAELKNKAAAKAVGMKALAEIREQLVKAGMPAGEIAVKMREHERLLDARIADVFGPG
jgi:hypothetical protein